MTHFWIAGRQADSNGVFRTITLYCYTRSGAAKRDVKLIERYRSDPASLVGKEKMQAEMKSLEGVIDLRVMEPAEYVDRYSRAKAEYRASKKANEGCCPNCGKRKFQTGKALGRKARRCLKCGHVWFKVKIARKPSKSDYRLTKTEQKVLDRAA